MKATANNRFSLGLKLNNDQTSNAMARIGVHTTHHSWISSENGTTLLEIFGGSYTPNTDMKIKFVYNQGNMKLYIDDVYQGEANIAYYPIYLMLHSYSTSKTVSVSNIKIKPL